MQTAFCFVLFCFSFVSKEILTIREAVWLTDNTYKYEDLVRMMGEIISALEGRIKVKLCGGDRTWLQASAAGWRRVGLVCSGPAKPVSLLLRLHRSCTSDGSLLGNQVFLYVSILFSLAWHCRANQYFVYALLWSPAGEPYWFFSHRLLWGFFWLARILILVTSSLPVIL